MTPFTESVAIGQGSLAYLLTCSWENGLPRPLTSPETHPIIHSACPASPFCVS